MSSRTSQSGAAELIKHIQSVSNQLRVLHTELYWIALEEEAGSKQEQFVDLDLHQVMDFKCAVDNMRELLWKYLEVAAKIEPQRVQEAAEAHRVRRLTELLQLLRERLGYYAEEQPMSFIEQISASLNDRLPDDSKAA
ncbi:MAG TPA: hypothetical protein VNV88_04155 [Candidatus Solibacter sp.]|jgi:hypothetical protein|nr:hypothetical protein [Candidatus Solibacter sp.]